MSLSESFNLLQRFEPDDRALLVWLAPHVTDAMLHEIAACDYGFDADLNFDRLVRIRDTAEVPAPLDWNPKEVLELTRWTEPRDPALWHRTPASVEQFCNDHLKRAFACAALIRAGSDPESAANIDSDGDTLALLIESLVAGDADGLPPGLRSLTAAALSTARSDSDERALFALAVLLLAVQLDDFVSDAALIAALLDWIDAERESHWMNREFGGYSLLELSDSFRTTTWRRLAREILIDPYVGTAAVDAPDGSFMHAARPPWRACPVADRLVALGRAIAEARTD